VASKAKILAVGTLHQQNIATRQPLSACQNKLVSSYFFELLANSVMISIKQAFTSLQHSLVDGNVWMSYNCLYHQLSTVVSLIVFCIIPLAKNLLTVAQPSAVDWLAGTMKGVLMLVDACASSASPPAALKSRAVLQLNSSPDHDHALFAVLNSQPPVRSSCSCTAPVIQFSHVLQCFQELFNVSVSILDMHAAAILSMSPGPQLDTHFRGLSECLNSAMKIVK
jgi:hypothetical protein